MSAFTTRGRQKSTVAVTALFLLLPELLLLFACYAGWTTLVPPVAHPAWSWVGVCTASLLPPLVAALSLLILRREPYAYPLSYLFQLFVLALIGLGIFLQPKLPGKATLLAWYALVPGIAGVAVSQLLYFFHKKRQKD